MDLSVLERQTALLQHLLQQHSHSWQSQENVHFDGHALVDHHQVLSHRWRPDRRPRILPIPGTTDASLEKDHPMGSYSAVSSCNNSSVTGFVPISKPYEQCNSSSTNRASNSSSPLKKRKPEFDVEGEDKGKRHEAEEVGEEKSEVTTKTRREISTNTCAKVCEVQKPDYIHVRARRGQATDSHSLAERARREKISKKMKCLQDLVPGCNKVTGKAGMLDEIINYIQSLQKQVELLSMKLAAINPRLDLSIEIPTCLASLPAAAQFDATNSICFQYNPVQQGPSNFGTDVAMDQSLLLPQKSGSSSVTIPDVLLDPSCISQFQQMSGWESDWSSQFNAGFH